MRNQQNGSIVSEGLEPAQGAVGWERLGPCSAITNELCRKRHQRFSLQTERRAQATGRGPEGARRDVCREGDCVLRLGGAQRECRAEP